jgi:hypothetical protein
VPFIREADIIFTSDHWKAVVKCNLSPYQEATGTLQADLMTVKEIPECTTPMGE